MKCDFELLNLYIDGYLSKSQEEELLALIGSRPACREELDFLRAYKSAVAGINEVAPPDGLLPSVLKKAAQERKKTGRHRLLRAITACAAAALLTGAVLLATMEGSLPPIPAPMAAPIPESAAGAAQSAPSGDAGEAVNDAAPRETAGAMPDTFAQHESAGADERDMAKAPEFEGAADADGISVTAGQWEALEPALAAIDGLEIQTGEGFALCTAVTDGGAELLNAALSEAGLAGYPVGKGGSVRFIIES